MVDAADKDYDGYQRKIMRGILIGWFCLEKYLWLWWVSLTIRIELKAQTLSITLLIYGKAIAALIVITLVYNNI